MFKWITASYQEEKFGREKLISKLKQKSMLITATFVLLCMFTNTVIARETEIPDNLILEKKNSIADLALKAKQDIILTQTYTAESNSILLKWNSPQESSSYRVYQSKNEGAESQIKTVNSTSTTITGIRDEAVPSAPKVTATKSADGIGNNIKITASTDVGTTYRHRVENIVNKNQINGDVLFLIDLSGTMGDFRYLFMQEDGPILTISNKLIRDYNMRVGTAVMAYSPSSMIIGEFTQDINRIREYVRDFGNRNNHLFSVALDYAIDRLNKAGGKNKIIILFSDCDSDFDGDFEDSSDIAAKKQRLIQMKQMGIKLYTIYRATDSRLYINQYSDAFIVQPEVNKNKQVDAFNKIFNYIVEDMREVSNTVSTSVTSGIKGYQYAITTKSTHTFKNEPIVSLDQIPTYVSGEENAIQYLHIRAVDNAGNVSDTRSILLQVPPRIILTSNYKYGMNYVPLSWKINDKRAGYTYKLYRKQEGESNYKEVTKDTNNHVEKLVSSTNKSASYTTPGTYTWTVPQGVTSVTVTAAGAGGGGSGNARYKGTTTTYETKTDSYTTPGTYTWTAPAGVTSVTAEIAGAGGGGRWRLFKWFV